MTIYPLKIGLIFFSTIPLKNKKLSTFQPVAQQPGTGSLPYYFEYRCRFLWLADPCSKTPIVGLCNMPIF